jgi:peptidyl-prolyl cis-trans isomerase A (cyclophilin A)
MNSSANMPSSDRIRSIGYLFPLLIITLSCSRGGLVPVAIETDLGKIVLEIDTMKAPVTAHQFLKLVQEGVYTNACFYRVVRMDNQPMSDVKIEVIQGGLLEDSLIGSISPIVHEPTTLSGIRHTNGVISMARDQPGSASSEFFICIGDQPSLDYGGGRNPDGQGFAAFGKVTSGMEVVKAIQSLPDSAQRLVEPVRIRQIRILRSFPLLFTFFVRQSVGS